MKIYNSRRNIELKDFVGKDVWVKCFHTHGEFNVYVRPLSCYGDFISYNEMPDFFVDEGIGEMFGKDELVDSLTDTYSANIDTFKIVYPLETMSSEEVVKLVEDYDGTPFY